MSRPLWGGSAAAAARLSATVLLYAQPSIAEPLAGTSQETQNIQLNNNYREIETPGADVSPLAELPAATGGTVEAEKARAGTFGAAPRNAGTAPALGGDTNAAGPTLSFTATAYSLRGRMASGRYVGRGLIAADRRVLPLGTRVRLEAGPYSGEYLVADTGGLVRGRKIDIWVPSTGEAMRFGRRSVKLTVLSRGRTRATSPQKGR
jgi:3D (Asp-Asp-Asp) domain-containing protein